MTVVGIGQRVGEIRVIHLQRCRLLMVDKPTKHDREHESFLSCGGGGVMRTDADHRHGAAERVASHVQQRKVTLRRDGEVEAVAELVSGSGVPAKGPNLTVADAGALDCGVCSLPLKPPIFQCDVGHMLCLPCHDKLKGIGKCHVCGVAMAGGYRRCHGMERLVDSLRAACPNAPYGCAETPPYHGRDEHIRTCPHAPRAGFAGGSMAALLEHFRAAHGWPCVDVEAKNFGVCLRDGFNFVAVDCDTVRCLLLIGNRLAAPSLWSASAARDRRRWNATYYQLETANQTIDRGDLEEQRANTTEIEHPFTGSPPPPWIIWLIVFHVLFCVKATSAQQNRDNEIEAGPEVKDVGGTQGAPPAAHTHRRAWPVVCAGDVVHCRRNLYGAFIQVYPLTCFLRRADRRPSAAAFCVPFRAQIRASTALPCPSPLRRAPADGLNSTPEQIADGQESRFPSRVGHSPARKTCAFVVDDKDMDSDEALMALYERWCKVVFGEERSREEMQLMRLPMEFLVS
ncbi:hypothetical protein HU200_020474 [Digitaria exilis]|uniref:RING-type E3 ubiquitin transferase n=1 Tax=Digitaria exilis TaxID=1010633 RepID=A0A835F292_9POAL|nr:hypothetical protein HU200_020474 [Digitaria exilis]